MVNSMVERATSSMLIGPDWAMNTEICDICNHDPARAKDIVKGIKKRIGSKNPKAQLLALTLLETIMKNCGDFIHMHVAERDVLHEMVKIVKKKPDFHVKEKILILIDTWQEAFGGTRARYPQYYAAYHELLRLGAVFPKKSDTPTPNPQTQNSRSSYANNPENGSEATGPSELPTLSLTELQNARGIMDVLAEMLTAIDPEKKEGLRQEVIVDLVEQCRSYKQRVVHLVNLTSDESLLCQGLALNDDLQRLLAKHESLVSHKSKPDAVEASLIDTGDTHQPDAGSTSGSGSGVGAELVPVTTNAEEVNPKFDLLSGDDFSSENFLAIVPMPTGEPEPSTTTTPPPPQQHNALALADILSQNSSNNNNVASAPAGQTFQQSQNIDTNATTPNTPRTPFNLGWQQQPPADYGNDRLPPPPWEAQSMEGYPQPQTNDMSMYIQQPTHLPPFNSQSQQMIPNQQVQSGSLHMHPQQFYPNQMQQQPPPYGYGYGYGQQQNAQFIDQRMSGLSLNSNPTTVYTGPSMANASYVHLPSGKPTKPEDKLFGDLLDFSKVKPNKT